ncbi:MAG: molybdenum cofactor guanylyltransferase [Abitibacteriaceae bacterium]|nr:molybdenum cofactor guanylyltransferase [Abditibacteriaceae bacterium]
MNVRCATIIAGGASRRMGRDKALLSIKGQPLIAHIAEVLRQIFPDLVVVTSNATIADAAHAHAISDIYPGKGPLAGIHVALKHWEQPTFCVACDMPYLNADYIRHLCAQLEDFDAVIPCSGDYAEPLHAVYTPVCLPVIESTLQQERVGPVSSIYKQLKVRFIEGEQARQFDPALRMFENWNTPEEVKMSLTTVENL